MKIGERVIVRQRVRKEVHIVQPLFYVSKGNELKMQAVWAKTCRGAMTRYIIENRITIPERLHAFSYEGFNYNPSLGEPDYEKYPMRHIEKSGRDFSTCLISAQKHLNVQLAIQPYQ